MSQEADHLLPGGVRERTLLILLAVIQFSNILDFLIIVPLGPQYMRVFEITARQFGFIVSAYGISAGVCGVIGALFLDRFDRRKALLFLLAGFTIGTFLCAIAPGYLLLMGARLMAGAFGGLTGATVLAIVGDAVPEARRGHAIGMVMSSFSVAMIVGVPAGVMLANSLSWHAPFFLITIMSAAVFVLGFRLLPPLRGHLGRVHEPLRDLARLLSDPNAWKALGTIALLTCSGFMVVPYLSAYMVKNIGLTEAQLPYVYLCGGACTFFTMNWIGRLADKHGKLRVFKITAVLSSIPMLWMTSMGPSALWKALAVSTLMMIATSGRYVPAMAIVTASVHPRERGRFMSLTSAVQHFSTGIAATLSGLILGQSANGRITNYLVSGGASVVFALLAVAMASRVRSARASITS